MLKISRVVNGIEVDHNPPAYFTRQLTHRGTDARIVVTLPAAEHAVLRQLASVLEAPFQVLYVLHSPPHAGDAGRYQSPELSYADLAAFLEKFERFLAQDARADIWVRSIGAESLLVWDRHHEVFAYGSTEKIIAKLKELGFCEGCHTHPGPHKLHVRAECDAEAAALLSALSWTRGELQPGDRRYDGTDE